MADVMDFGTQEGGDSCRETQQLGRLFGRNPLGDEPRFFGRIGGRGFGPDANEVYEEGLQIPIMKFAHAGTVSRDLINIVRANVREPDQVVGDMYSLAACNFAGEKRLHAMLDEFGLDDLDALSDFILTASREATENAISALPSGKFKAQMKTATLQH